jgi:hypothetical protein
VTVYRPDGRRTIALALIQGAAELVQAASLASCGPAETGLQRDAARQLKVRVLGVSLAGADSDHAEAVTALDGLESELSTAAANGQVSEERRRTIMTVITAVRADLNAAVDAAAKAAADAKAAEEKAKADADAAAKAAQESAAPVAPAPAPAAPADNGKGNEGKGKGKD